MRIEGYYHASGAPYVTAQLDLPALGVAAEIHFLLDTGADETALMPSDQISMGISTQSIPGRHKLSAIGVGGRARYKLMQAVLRFSDPDDGETHQFDVVVALIARSKTSEKLPFLLGRDILNQCRSIFDPHRAEIILET